MCACIKCDVKMYAKHLSQKRKTKQAGEIKGKGKLHKLACRKIIDLKQRIKQKCFEIPK